MFHLRLGLSNLLCDDGSLNRTHSTDDCSEYRAQWESVLQCSSYTQCCVDNTLYEFLGQFKHPLLSLFLLNLFLAFLFLLLKSAFCFLSLDKQYLFLSKTLLQGFLVCAVIIPQLIVDFFHAFSTLFPRVNSLVVKVCDFVKRFLGLFELEVEQCAESVRNRAEYVIVER